MAGTILYDSPHLRVIAHLIADGPVFITFNEMGLLISGDRYWGDDFFQKRGIASIGVMTPRPNWYPPEEMKHAAQAIREIVRGRRLITYGLSQGAYGALKYARVLEADTALAFCPQWSIDPADVAEFDRRFLRYHVHELANGTRIEPGEIAPHSYVFYDPLTVNDRTHANRILRYDGAVGIKCPFTGHYSLRQLVEGGEAVELIAAIADNPMIPAARLRSFFRRTRLQSRTYVLGRIDTLLKRKKFGFVRKTLKDIPPEFSLYAEMLLAIDGAGGAVPAADALQKLTDGDMYRIGINHLWEQFRFRGFLPGELRAARLMRITLSAERAARLRVVDTFIRADLRDEARRELDGVIEEFGPHEEAGRIADLKARLA